jgi:hypothetical protein
VRRLRTAAPTLRQVFADPLAARRRRAPTRFIRLCLPSPSCCVKRSSPALTAICALDLRLRSFCLGATYAPRWRSPASRPTAPRLLFPTTATARPRSGHDEGGGGAFLVPRARFQPRKGRHRNRHRAWLLQARVAALRWAKRRRRHGWRSERRGVQARWIAAPPGRCLRS